MKTIDQVKAEGWRQSMYDEHSNAKYAFEIGFDLGYEHANTWILASDRLPDVPARYVITYLRRGDMRRLVRPATFESGRFWRMHSPTAYCDVLAWRPLPEPYRGDVDSADTDNCSICGEPMIEQMDHPFCLATMQGKDWV